MAIEPKMIRPGAVQALVYNEGLCAYLLDAENEGKIAEIIDESEDDFPAEDSDESVSLRPLAKQGLMVTYELMQDDELSLQIVVGEPATAEERRIVPMLRPLRSFLSLPSGKLRIHSSNTAPWSDPTDEGRHGTVEVPPGDYVVTIHHIDFDRVPQETRDDPARMLAAQFVFLTPTTEKPKSRSSVFIRYPE